MERPSLNRIAKAVVKYGLRVGPPLLLVLDTACNAAPPVQNPLCPDGSVKMTKNGIEQPCGGQAVNPALGKTGEGAPPNEPPVGETDPAIQDLYSEAGEEQRQEITENVSPTNDPDNRNRNCVKVPDDPNTNQDAYPLGTFFGKGTIVIYDVNGKMLDSWDLDKYLVPPASLIATTGELTGCAEN